MKNNLMNGIIKKSAMTIIITIAVMMVMAAFTPVVVSAKPVNPPSSFIISTIDSSGGNYPRMVMDSGNNLHISYYDPSKYSLKYATNVGGAWAIETIETFGSPYAPSGGVADIALDSTGTVHVLYIGLGQNLKYAYKEDGVWHKQSIASQVFGQCSILVDSADGVHICYWEDLNSPFNSIKYGKLVDGSWNLENVVHDTVTFSWDVEMAFDTNGKLHILWLGLFDYKLRLATRGESAWISDILPLDGPIGPGASFVIDPSNHVHIAYERRSGTTYQLWYASDATGSWNTLMLDSTTNVRIYPSIGLDATGHVYISYAKYTTSTKSNLMCASNLSGSWAIKLVDGTRNVGVLNDIAIDSNSKVHISYSGSGLKYAKSI